MKKRNLKIVFSLIVSMFLICIAGNDFLAQEPKKTVKKILSIEAFDLLNSQADTYLIDVRTRAEYQFTGHPKQAYHFPYMFMSNKLGKTDGRFEYQFNLKNKDFISEIKKAFNKGEHLLIISRDGKRSSLAAKDLLDAGFENVYDVEDGFEGKEFPYFKDPDKDKYYKNRARQNMVHGFMHRRHDGWQYWGLPWTYELDLKYIYPPDRSPGLRQ